MGLTLSPRPSSTTGAGQIVTVNWRKEPSDSGQDPQPPEPNKLSPAVVVQPSPTNGCKKVSYLLPQHRSHQFGNQPSRITVN